MTYTDSELTDIATAILDQMGGYRSIQIMAGGKAFAVPDRAPGVCVKFKLRGRNGVNMVSVILTPMDVYSVRFYSSGKTVKTVSEFENVYGDELKALVESETGLCLSIPQFAKRA